MRQMKTMKWYLFRSIALTILSFIICGCNENAIVKTVNFKILDTNKQLESVIVGPNAIQKDTSNDDVHGILSAVGRTPFYSKLEVIKVEVFPKVSPVAACVTVRHSLLMLIKEDSGEWHVIKAMSFKK